MSLDSVKLALRTNTDLATRMSIDAWIADEEIRAERVRLYREYVDGEHRANMTPEMRRLLRLNTSTSGLEFNDNYMDIVVQTLADRIEVSGVETDDRALEEWAQALFRRTRFDNLQAIVHEAAIRDGDAFVMVEVDPATRYPRLVYEPAYDGTNGMIVLYESVAAQRPMLAAKVWQLMPTSDAGKTSLRINVYYADRVERYIQRGGGALETFEDGGIPYTQPLMGVDGAELGLPVIHFRNRRASYDNYGISELNNAIPLQDALNRNLYSMVMAAELTAFRIFTAKGFEVPGALTPGMIINMSGGQAVGKDDVLEFGAIEGADLTQFISLSTHYAQEIARVTRTPAPELIGTNASGEARKQYEVGLVGKARRFQVSAGSAWEDCIEIAHRMETTYGGRSIPPWRETWIRWRNPEVRNQKDIVEMALLAAPLIKDERTLLRLIAGAFDLSPSQIDTIIEANAQQQSSAILRIGAQIPTFESAGQGLEPIEEDDDG